MNLRKILRASLSLMTFMYSSCICTGAFESPTLDIHRLVHQIEFFIKSVEQEKRHSAGNKVQALALYNSLQNKLGHLSRNDEEQRITVEHSLSRLSNLFNLKTKKPEEFVGVYAPTFEQVSVENLDYLASAASFLSDIHHLVPELMRSLSSLLQWNISLKSSLPGIYAIPEQVVNEESLVGNALILEHPEQREYELASFQFLFYPYLKVIVAPSAQHVVPNLNCLDYLKCIHPLGVKLSKEYHKPAARILAAFLLQGTLYSLLTMLGARGLGLGLYSTLVLLGIIAENALEAFVTNALRVEQDDVTLYDQFLLAKVKSCPALEPCKYCEFTEKGLLSCQCSLPGFPDRETTIDTALCVKEITNCDGELFCGDCPAYTHSCRECTLEEDGILTCECRYHANSTSPAVDTSIDTKTCAQEIYNCHGNLVCGKECPAHTHMCGGCRQSVNGILTCFCSDDSPDDTSHWWKAVYNTVSINTNLCAQEIHTCHGNLVCGKECPAYTQRCRGCQQSEMGNLSCFCLDEKGYWKRVSINTKLCAQEIHNCNGNLVCGSGCPAYTQSCQECNQDEEGGLSCRCLDDDQDSHYVSINTKLCAKEIHNCNGNLVCGKECPAYTQSCLECTQFIDGDLWCKCLNDEHLWPHTSINTKLCTQEIHNCNGNLICGKECPAYTQSCQGCIQDDGGNLRCTCRGDYQDLYDGSINMKLCAALGVKDIHNCHGKLACGGCTDTK